MTVEGKNSTTNQMMPRVKNDQLQITMCRIDLGGPTWSKSDAAKIKPVKSCHVSLMI